MRPREWGTDDGIIRRDQNSLSTTVRRQLSTSQQESPHQELILPELNPGLLVFRTMRKSISIVETTSSIAFCMAAQATNIYHLKQSLIKHHY